jgi:hypothetical protein
LGDVRFLNFLCRYRGHGRSRSAVFVIHALYA